MVSYYIAENLPRNTFFKKIDSFADYLLEYYESDCARNILAYLILETLRVFLLDVMDSSCLAHIQGLSLKAWVPGEGIRLFGS